MSDRVVARSRFARLARIVGAQVAVALAIAAALLQVKGGIAALSAVVGGAIAFVPAALYAGRMVVAPADDPRALLGAQYRAEAYKTVATLGLFAATFFFFRGVAALWLFVTYAATLMVYFVALLIDV